MALKRVLVPVKQVIDFAVKIRVKPDKTGVETNNVKTSINPFDEIAIEQAIQLKEKGLVQEVVAVTMGPKPWAEILRKSMALGADRAIHIETEQDLQPLAVAKLLQKLSEKETPDLLILGKQAIDDDSCQTSQMVASLLDWPQGMFASAVEVNTDQKVVNVTREIDGGLETIALDLPAVISADLRLNTPRFAKLQNIMKARKMPIEVLTPESLGVDIKPRMETVSVVDPPTRAGGIKVKSVQELVDKLRSDGVL